MTRTARLRALAKLNLGIRVLYKRPDGFHELRTVFQTISLADRLDVSYTPAPATRIRIDGAPHIPDNLVEKAARAVLEELQLNADIVFNLKKIIPSGAGLGGGSSDAAAVLLALPVLAGRTVPMERLVHLAARLGSDVPFFLYGGTALGIGRGEELYPLPGRPPTRALLVAPDVHSSTAEAYSGVSRRLTSTSLQNKIDSFRREIWKGERGAREGSAAGPGVSPDDLTNDFEEVIFGLHPKLAGIKNRLIEMGAATAAMTGSGSAIFGVFEDAEALERARRALSSGADAANKCFTVSFVSRAQYRSGWMRALKDHVKGDPWPPLSRYAR